jgi:hypothetical protein
MKFIARIQNITALEILDSRGKPNTGTEKLAGKPKLRRSGLVGGRAPAIFRRQLSAAARAKWGGVETGVFGLVSGGIFGVSRRFFGDAQAIFRRRTGSFRRRTGSFRRRTGSFRRRTGGQSEMGAVKVNLHTARAKVFIDGANVFKGEAKAEAVEAGFGAIRVKTQTGGVNLRTARVKM